MRAEPGHLVAAVVISLIGSWGCGSDDRPTRSQLRVRLLTSAPVSGRWEIGAERGLGRIAAELGADVGRLRARNEGERRALLAAQGADGIELVFCVGPGFEQALYTEAPAFPETGFVILPGAPGGGNVAGVELRTGGAGYVAGVAASLLSEGGGVGIVRGTGGEWLDGLEEGFIRGVHRGNPEIIPRTVTRPGGPRNLAAEQVDVALYASDRAEEVVIQEARAAGMWLVVCDLGLLDSEPEVVAAAVHLDVAEAMVRLAREVRDGTFAGGRHTFDLGSGVVDVVLNRDLAPAADPEMAEAVEAARSEAITGIAELEKLGM
jgi:basic membrane lipoprotein Med (substrate-binding protein (PBP1-ABC) superfamily)